MLPVHFKEIAESFVGLFNLFLEDADLFCDSIPMDHPTNSLPSRTNENGNVKIKLQFMQIVEMCARQYSHGFNHCFHVFNVAFHRARENDAFLAFYDDAQGTIILSQRQLLSARDKFDLGSLLFGPRYFRYRVPKSTAEIQVEHSDGNIYTGTSFFYSTQSGLNCLLTCRHNLFENEGRPDERFFSKIAVLCDGVELKIRSVIRYSKIDCCMIGLVGNDFGEPLSIFESEDPLDSVVAAGFPRVQLVEASPLLLAGGQIYGRTNSRNPDDDLIVMSCDVAPGFSGGPLINDYGSVVGMIHRRIRTDSLTVFGEDTANYGTAIPIGTITRLIDDSENRVFRLDESTGSQNWIELN